MDWLKSRTVQRFVIIGFLGGLLVLILAYWLEFNENHLPFAWSSFSYLYRARHLTIMMDLAPIVFAIIAGLLGMQYSLLAQYLRHLCSGNWLKNGMNHAQTGNLLKNLG